MLSPRLAPTLSLANGFPQDDTNVASAMPVSSSSRRARPGSSKFAHSSYPTLRLSSLQSLSFCPLHGWYDLLSSVSFLTGCHVPFFSFVVGAMPPFPVWPDRVFLSSNTAHHFIRWCHCPTLLIWQPVFFPLLCLSGAPMR